jgi:purine nucleosidase
VREKTVPERVILDTDIGTDVDDAYAIALLVNCPEVKIEAITTVWADARLRARMVRKLLDLLDRPDIPVAAGESLPVNPERPAFLMGHEGRGVVDDDEDLSLLEEPAGVVIESLLRKYPREIKVLLIGPQTNLGKLLSEKPDLAPLIKEFVVMGGTPFYGPKEIQSFGERAVDYNMITDPEAARIVFSSGVPITMIGTNVTMPTLLKKDHIERIQKHGAPSTDLLYSMTSEWLGVIDKPETPMHDPLAVTAAFNLEFLETMMLNIKIETKGELTAGLTVVNHYDFEGLNAVRVATDARSDEFIEFMLQRILS